MSFESITPESIAGMTATDLLDEGFIDAILWFGEDGDPADKAERERLRAASCARANHFGIKSEFVRYYNAAKRAKEEAEKAEKQEQKREKEQKEKLRKAAKESMLPAWQLKFARNRYGEPINTTNNFLVCLEHDEHFAGMQFNELSYSPEQVRNGKAERWTDSDDAEARKYIEDTYGIHSVQKMDDALRIRFANTAYHPVRDYIRSLEWDGIDRIEQFWQFAVKAEDTPYIREASRLVFAGGINRAFNPGCKFDEMIVLVGTHQGEGKSTLVRWLAMKDEWFGEISEIDGQKGIESLEGKWILEMAELLAMVRAREAEAQKAYVTRQVDRYRHPFDKRVTEHQRQCIFIGTTNKAQFLTDKTGNRRYFPVQIMQSGYDMYARESEIKEYIKNCWAEAHAKYGTDFMKPYANRALIEEIREQQAAATEDDFREGLIASYLDDNGIDEVSIIEVWRNALHKDQQFCSDPSKRESNEIGIILTNLGFTRSNKVKKFKEYGVQRYFYRCEKRKNSDSDSDFPPF